LEGKYQAHNCSKLTHNFYYLSAAGFCKLNLYCDVTGTYLHKAQWHHLVGTHLLTEAAIKKSLAASSWYLMGLIDIIHLLGQGSFLVLVLLFGIHFLVVLFSDGGI